MASIGSAGLDVQGIVSQLMNIERRPLRVLDRKISALQNKTSAIGKLRSAISTLADSAKKLSSASKLGQFVAKSSNEDVLTATASSVEVEESHQITVTQLASRHRLASTKIYQSTQDDVGAGTYAFQVGGKTFEVELAAGKSSLADLSNAINRASDNPGINASVIHVDQGYRLVLSARESGTANIISADGQWEEISQARDAAITVDGLEIHPSSNTVSDVIPGVTLALKSTGKVDLTVSADTDKMTGVLKEFADNYNALRTTLRNLNEGDLKGEGLAFSLENSIRNTFFQKVNDATNNGATAFDFGLTFDKNGVLNVDESKVRDAIGSNLNGMLDFFTSDQGFGSSFVAALDAITRNGGVLDSRKKSFGDAISRLETRSSQLESRLENIRKRYLATYSKLDALMAQMNDTSNRLSQQLGGLATKAP